MKKIILKIKNDITKSKKIKKSTYWLIPMFISVIVMFLGNMFLILGIILFIFCAFKAASSSEEEHNQVKE
jgi:hypothetical protein